MDNVTSSNHSESQGSPRKKQPTLTEIVAKKVGASPVKGNITTLGFRSERVLSSEEKHKLYYSSDDEEDRQKAIKNQASIFRPKSSGA